MILYKIDKKPINSIMAHLFPEYFSHSMVFGSPIIFPDLVVKYLINPTITAKPIKDYISLRYVPLRSTLRIEMDTTILEGIFNQIRNYHSLHSLVKHRI